jgi:hypothetical protein
MSDSAMCPDCDGMGVIHAMWTFDGDRAEPEQECARCEGTGHLYGEAARRVLAARALAKRRTAMEMTQRGCAQRAGFPKLSHWSEIERGLVPLEEIQSARELVETWAREDGWEEKQ